VTTLSRNLFEQDSVKAQCLPRALAAARSPQSSDVALRHSSVIIKTRTRKSGAGREYNVTELDSRAVDGSRY
jgi:hypothetical protein